MQLSSPDRARLPRCSVSRREQGSVSRQEPAQGAAHRSELFTSMEATDEWELRSGRACWVGGSAGPYTGLLPAVTSYQGLYWATGLPEAVLGYQGLYWRSGTTGLPGAVLGYQGLFWATRDRTGLPGL